MTIAKRTSGALILAVFLLCGVTAEAAETVTVSAVVEASPQQQQAVAEATTDLGGNFFSSAVEAFGEFRTDPWVGAKEAGEMMLDSLFGDTSDLLGAVGEATLSGTFNSSISCHNETCSASRTFQQGEQVILNSLAFEGTDCPISGNRPVVVQVQGSGANGTIVELDERLCSSLLVIDNRLFLNNLL